MATFRPMEEMPMNVPMKVLQPTWKKVNGVSTKVYPEPEDVTEVIFGSIKTYGGTMTEVNGIIGVENTATIRIWYRPDIKADCRIVLLESGVAYDLMGDPEDINMAHRILQMKVKRIGGKNG